MKGLVSMSNHKGILLESGTNELEIVEFEVGHNTFGINVMKVREIIQPLPITFVPNVHPHLEGIIQLRGEVLPLIDMRKVLNMDLENRVEDEKFIITEFNQQKVVFRVDNVSQIHRISWEQIEKPSSMYESHDANVIGVIKHNDSMILLLDFEKIVHDINEDKRFSVETVKKLGERERSNKKIVVAEDSPLLRQLLEDTLTEAGYVNLTFFENGKLAYDYLHTTAENNQPLDEQIQLLITDIEMPQMDGHHLTKKVKEHDVLKQLPVLIFSSLITDDLRHKGEQVGAIAQVSKPEIAELIHQIDTHIL